MVETIIAYTLTGHHALTMATWALFGATLYANPQSHHYFIHGMQHVCARCVELATRVAMRFRGVIRR